MIAMTNQEVRISPGGEFGGRKISELEIARNVAAGSLEMGVAASTPMSNFYDKLAVLDLPFLIRDLPHGDKVLDGPIGERLLEGLLRHHIRGLTFYNLDFRIIPTTNIEIRRPEDLRGLKIRTMEGQVYISMFKTWKSEAVPAPVREIIPMAKRGYIHGADRSYPTYWDYNQQEVFKVVNETQHAYAAQVLLINEPFFQRLPKNHRTIVIGAARESAKLQRVLYRAHTEEVVRMCKASGIKIVKLTPEERLAFQAASKPVYDQFTPIFGRDLIRDIRDTRS